MSQESTNAGTETARKMVSVNGKELGQKQEGNLKFVRPAKLTEADVNTVVATGIYEGSTPNNFDAEKPDFKVRAANGDLTIINNCASIAKQFGKLQEGSYVEVTYLGKNEIKDGKYKGKQSHSFLIAVDAADLAAGE